MAATELLIQLSKEHTNKETIWQQSVRKYAEILFHHIPENLPLFLQGLDDVRLIILWRNMLHAVEMSINKFCLDFSLNHGIFGQWLKGSRRSFASKYAVVTYLIAGSTTTNGEYMLSKLMYVRNSILNNQPENICFVDADNCVFMLKEPILAKKNGLILAFCTPGSLPKVDKYLPSIHTRIEVITTLTSTQNAADHALSMEMAILDIFLPTSIAFELVSDDKFTVEVAERICMRRKCTIILPKRTTPITTAFTQCNEDTDYNTFDIPTGVVELLDRLQNILPINEHISMASIGRIVPLSAEHKAEYTSWLCILRRPGVLEYLSAELVDDHTNSVMLCRSE